MQPKSDPTTWKNSTRLLLGVVTVWPHFYLIFFVAGVFYITVFLDPSRRAGYCGGIDINQLEHKIWNGELNEIVVKPTEVVARSRSDTCEYRVAVSDEHARRQILREARKLDANGVPLVPKISEEGVSPFAVVGFIAVFVIHMLTLVLVLALIAIYVVLAINNQQFDQTKKIIWVVAMCMLTMVAMPVYWYLHVWRKPSAVSRNDVSAMNL